MTKNLNRVTKITDTWDIDDIKQCLTERFENKDFNNKTYENVLKEMERCYDANVGYSWDAVINAYDNIKEAQ